LLPFGCSATKLCPNGTTLSSRNCKIVLAWFLSNEALGDRSYSLSLRRIVENSWEYEPSH
jgi:hypothetical protein